LGQRPHAPASRKQQGVVGTVQVPPASSICNSSTGGLARPTDFNACGGMLPAAAQVTVTALVSLKASHKTVPWVLSGSIGSITSIERRKNTRTCRVLLRLVTPSTSVAGCVSKDDAGADGAVESLAFEASIPWAASGVCAVVGVSHRADLHTSIWQKMIAEAA
jgi:hypothetical protein